MTEQGLVLALDRNKGYLVSKACQFLLERQLIQNNSYSRVLCPWNKHRMCHCRNIIWEIHMRQKQWLYIPWSGEIYTSDWGSGGITVGIWNPLAWMISSKRPRHISALCKCRSALSTFAIALSSFLRARSLYKRYFLVSLLAFRTRRIALIGESILSGKICVLCE